MSGCPWVHNKKMNKGVKSADWSTETVDHNNQDAVEGTTQEDLECWDASEESVPSSQTTIDVETIRGAQVTMMNHMVGHVEDGIGIVNWSYFIVIVLLKSQLLIIVFELYWT